MRFVPRGYPERFSRRTHLRDPALVRARWLWDRATPQASLVCVYRERFVQSAEAIARAAQHLGMDVALWGLEGVSPRLADLTIGGGPGQRLALLNRLVSAVEARRRGGALVITDDDVVFVRGGLRRLLAAVEHGGFGIAQPSLSPDSFWSHEITRTRPLTLARQTTFVETGPMVVIGEAWRPKVLPLPEDFGMGWGLDILWYDLCREGCRLGVIDAVSLRHLAATGGSYDYSAENARVARLIAERGLGEIGRIQNIVASWRVWQPRPPWR